MNWEHHLFFPTRVLISQSDDESMRAEILQLLERDPRFKREGYYEVADEEGLGDLVQNHSCMAKLKAFFLDGLRQWLKAENHNGDFRVDTFLLSNYSQPGDFIPAHNHSGANLSGVYYVEVPDYSDMPVTLQGGAQEYWRMHKGVLMLHDPRFYASLTGLDDKSYFVKVFPVPICLFCSLPIFGIP